MPGIDELLSACRPDDVAVVVDAAELAARNALRDFDAPTGCVALALFGGDLLSDGLGAIAMQIATRADRERSLALPAAERFWDAWAAGTYELEWECGPVPESDEHSEAERRVFAVLEDLAEDPSRVVLDRVAWRLTRDPPLANVSPEFVAFVADNQMSVDLARSLRYVTPPAIVDALRAQRLFDNPLEDYDELAGDES